MNTASIIIKTNEQTKRDAQQVAQEMGFSLSSVMNAFLKQFVRSKTIHISVSNEVPSQMLTDALHAAKRNREQGKGSPIFDTSEDTIAFLEKQGI